VKFFKYFIMNQSTFFKDIIISYQINHSQLTRFKANQSITVPPVKKLKCYNAFKCSAVRIWNCLPLSMRNIRSVNTFKTVFKQWLFLNMIK
jgi:hypothetical protein